MVLAALAVLLAAGCGIAHGAHYRATVQSCFSFGVHAIQRRLIVTHVPRACAGLSRAQVNISLARAVRAAAGPQPKAPARKAAERESKYLEDLFATVPPPRSGPLTAIPHQPTTTKPLQFAALGAWLATAAVGGYLLASWVAGARRRRSGHTARPPGVLIAHAALATAGLALWVAFLAASAVALAWLAVAVILVVAGLGMATLITGLPDPQAAVLAGSSAAAGATSTARPPYSVRSATAVRSESGSAPARAPTTAVLVIAVHGALATAAILLVLLAAIGTG
jgi:hypothetical protein